MPPKARHDSDDDDAGANVPPASAVVDNDAAFSADFTYDFLRGITTTGAGRPRQISIARKDLDKMTGMERQFWEIKMKFFDVAVFFKKGKFYELYDCDAVIANREFGLKMAQDLNNRGKMRMSGVPEQSFAEWSRLFVFKGYKVGKVEQMTVDEAMIAANGGKEPKCIPRELVSILTRGTVTDAAMLPGSDSNYVMAFTPASAEGGDSVDAVALDVSRRVFWHCPCRDVDELAALLYQLSPTEVVLSANLPSQAKLGSRASTSVSSDDIKRVALAVNPECAIEHLGTLPIPTRPNAPTNAEPPSAGVQPFDSPARQAAGDYLRYLKQDETQLLPRWMHSDPTPTAFTVYTAHRHGAVAAEQPSAADVLAAQAKKPLLAIERDDDHGLVMDAAAIESLELTANLRDGSKAGSMFTLYSGSGRHVCTPGGQRQLRQWVLRPSSNTAVVTARQQLVALLAGCPLSKVIDDPASITGRDIGTATELGDLWYSALGVSPARTASAPLTAGDSESMSMSSPATASVSSPSGRGPGRTQKLASLDLERLLGRVSDVANTDLRVSFADPLVLYPKHLAAIDATLQGFASIAKMGRDVMTWLEQQPEAARGAPGLRLLAELARPWMAVGEPVEAILSTTFVRSRIFGKDDSQVLPTSREQCPSYFEAVETMESCRAELDRKLVEFKSKIGNSASYSDLGKDLFLLEVPTAKATKTALANAGIPDGTLKERARTTKTVKMQVAPMAATVAQYKKAQLQKEQALIAVLCGVAKELCASWPQLFSASSSVAYFDCVAALGACAMQQASMGDICLPQFTSGSADANQATVIRAKEAFHPIVLLQSGKSVPNSISLDDESGRVLVLTGPNMAGKSTLMRCLAVAVISAQLGGFVCAKEFEMAGAPVDRIFTRIGARDATHRGLSTLHVELGEMATIHRAATGRSLCLIDELGRGTSTHDGYAIAHASLAALSGAPAGRRPLAVFSTHYHGLALDVQYRQEHPEAFVGVAPVQLGYMDFRVAASRPEERKREREDGAGDEESGPPAACASDGVTFVYRLVRGVCARSYGVEVAARAGIAPHVLETARSMSEALRVTATDMQLVAFTKDVVAGRSESAARRAAQLSAMAGAY